MLVSSDPRAVPLLPAQRRATTPMVDAGRFVSLALTVRCPATGSPWQNDLPSSNSHPELMPRRDYDGCCATTAAFPTAAAPSRVLRPSVRRERRRAEKHRLAGDRRQAPLLGLDQSSSSHVRGSPKSERATSTMAMRARHRRGPSTSDRAKTRRVTDAAKRAPLRSFTICLRVWSLTL